MEQLHTLDERSGLRGFFVAPHPPPHPSAVSFPTGPLLEALPLLKVLLESPNRGTTQCGNVAKCAVF